MVENDPELRKNIKIDQTISRYINQKRNFEVRVRGFELSVVGYIKRICGEPKELGSKRQWR